jgi:hypothetical protein
MMQGIDKNIYPKNRANIYALKKQYIDKFERIDTTDLFETIEKYPSLSFVQIEHIFKMISEGFNQVFAPNLKGVIKFHNLFTYAVDALFLDGNFVRGSISRKRITEEFKNFVIENQKKMSLLTATQFLYGREIWQIITQICDSHENIKVASPYVSDKVKFKWKSGDQLLIALSENNVRKGFVNPVAVEEIIKSGVKVYTTESLHAKIYSNGNSAIVSSCNLSLASQNEWLEAGVLISDTFNMEKVNTFFAENCIEQSLVTIEKLSSFKNIFNVQTDITKEEDDLEPFNGNLWSLVLIDVDKLEKSIEDKIQNVVNSAKKEHNNITYHYFRSKYLDISVGDYIIIFQKVNGDLKIFYPCECFKIDQITDELCVFHLSQKGAYKPIEWEKAKSYFSNLGLNPEKSLIIQKQRVLERLYFCFNQIS